MKNHNIDGTRSIRSNVEYTTTAYEIPGKTIVKNIGLVSGYSQQNIMSQGGIAASLIKRVTDKSLLKNLKNDAFEDILRVAESQGANAIIGIQMDISTLSGSGVGGSYSNVYCNIIGTAVCVENAPALVPETKHNEALQKESLTPVIDNTPANYPSSTKAIIGSLENAESCKEIYDVIGNYLSSKKCVYDNQLLSQIKEKMLIERMYGKRSVRTQETKVLANKLVDSLGE